MSDEWVIEYPAATIDELTAEAEKLGMYPPPKARLDEDGTAKPLTEIAAVFENVEGRCIRFDHQIVEYKVRTTNADKGTKVHQAAEAACARDDQREYERKSPRSTINELAEQWQNGPEEATGRLRNMLVSNARFDARDREALAYLLMKEWGVK